MELTSRGKALVAYTIEEAKRGRTNTRYISNMCCVRVELKKWQFCHSNRSEHLWKKVSSTAYHMRSKYNVICEKQSKRMVTLWVPYLGNMKNWRKESCPVWGIIPLLKLLRFIMIYCQEATDAGWQGRKEEKEKSNTNNHDASWCCISMICEVCTE